MGFIDGLVKITTGAAVGVATVTALPLAAIGMGGIGMATALGSAVGAGVGAAAVVADEIMDDKGKDPRDQGGAST